MRRVFLVLLNVQLAYLSIETSSFCGYLETRFLKKLSWLKTSEDIKDITDRFHFNFFFFFGVLEYEADTYAERNFAESRK